MPGHLQRVRIFPPRDLGKRSSANRYYGTFRLSICYSRVTDLLGKKPSQRVGGEYSGRASVMHTGCNAPKPSSVCFQMDKNVSHRFHSLQASKRNIPTWFTVLICHFSKSNMKEAFRVLAGLNNGQGKRDILEASIWRQQQYHKSVPGEKQELQLPNAEREYLKVQPHFTLGKNPQGCLWSFGNSLNATDIQMYS